ncbi:hypothetical protein MLD38_040481 [Melastoma candidum]|nr:hypothetical protein MLD38_040481 [Melastoma candidum]
MKGTRAVLLGAKAAGSGEDWPQSERYHPPYPTTYRRPSVLQPPEKELQRYEMGGLSSAYRMYQLGFVQNQGGILAGACVLQQTSGRGRIRTYVEKLQQIYSLSLLTTRPLSPSRAEAPLNGFSEGGRRPESIKKKQLD